MAKLTKAAQNVFALNATLDGTASGISQIGSLAAGSQTYTKDPVVIQALSNYLDGWGGCILGDNAPTVGDMNGLFFLITRQLKYIFENGVPEWDSVTTFYKNSIINVNGNLLRSLIDNNTNQAITDATKWGSAPGLIPVGGLVPFVDFGILTFDANVFKYMNGQVVSDVDSPLNGVTLTDMSGRMIVGFGTVGGGNNGSASWSATPVGNTNSTINLSHDHDVDMAVVDGSGNFGLVSYSNLSQPSVSCAIINPQNTAPYKIVTGATITNSATVTNTCPSNNRTTHRNNTYSALGSQSILPDSIRVRWLVRYK